MKWARGIDFWGRWMPDPPKDYRSFLGEHGWSPASRYFQRPYFGDDGWTQPSHGCPIKVRVIAFEYLREASGFDCSVDESYTLQVPASNLVAGLGLRWSAHGANYMDAEGKLAAFDPTAHEDGPSALLLRRDLLMPYLVREGLSVCWTILGEKRVVGPGFGPTYHASLRMTGAYTLSDNGPVGFVNYRADDYGASAVPEEAGA